jgi:putative DNA primase/helicase
MNGTVINKIQKSEFKILSDDSNQPLKYYISFDRYQMNSEGLWLKTNDQSDSEPKRVSAAFEILGRAREPDGNRWGLYIRWLDPDGRPHEKFISAAALQAEPGALCSELADQGLLISRSLQRSFQLYLEGAPIDKRITRVRRVGWQEVSNQKIFALPHIHLVRAGMDNLILDGVEASQFAIKGNLDDWRHSIGLQCKGQMLPMLAISTALAGPLLYLSNLEGGGIHIFGGSSIGKTTILAAAASVWGRGGSSGFIRTWRSTANGLEGASASSCDTALVVDELGLVDPKDLATAVYMLAGGMGKQRARINGSAQEIKSWRVMVVSSGEMPIAVKLSEDRGYKPKAGQLLRILDVSADQGNGFGVFTHITGFESPGLLAKSIKHSAQSFYGSAGPAFVKYLMARSDIEEHLHSEIQSFAKHFADTSTDSQIGRVAEKFGLIAVAGELAIEAGILPWEAGSATTASTAAFKSWLQERGSNEPYEVTSAVDQVRLFMEQYSGSRFHDLDDISSKQPINRAGWVKGVGDLRRWLIPPEIWKNEICRGHNATHVARYLAEKGMLEKSNDGYQQVHKIESGAKRVYVLNSKMFAH